MPEVYAGQLVTADLLSTSYAQSDFTAYNIGSATTGAQICNSYSIPAGEPQVGSVYRLRAYGDGTQGSTAQGLQFLASFGGLTTGTGLTYASSFASINQAFRWWLQAEAMCITTGASATWQLSLEGMCGPGTSGLSGVDQNATPVTMATTSPIAFFLAADWASATGSPSLSGLRSVFERIL
jgi:hypothetical protein